MSDEQKQPAAPAAADAAAGNSLLDQGRNAAAAEAYRTAIKLRPDYAEAHYNLGLALHGQQMRRLQHWERLPYREARNDNRR